MWKSNISIKARLLSTFLHCHASLLRFPARQAETSCSLHKHLAVCERGFCCNTLRCFFFLVRFSITKHKLTHFAQSKESRRFDSIKHFFLKKHVAFAPHTPLLSGIWWKYVKYYILKGCYKYHSRHVRYSRSGTTDATKTLQSRLNTDYQTLFKCLCWLNVHTRLCL